MTIHECHLNNYRLAVLLHSSLVKRTDTKPKKNQHTCNTKLESSAADTGEAGLLEVYVKVP